MRSRKGHKPDMITRLRAWILGLDAEKYQLVRTLLQGYAGAISRGNSVIMGGPTSWSWNATIDDAHHGSRGSGLHADSHNRAHDMDGASDHNPGTQGDLIYAASGGAWARRTIGTAGQVLTVVSGLPAWAEAAAGGIHGNESHEPDFYPLNGSERLTAPLVMELMAPSSEPSASAGNEGKLYYLTPGASEKGIIKQIMKNSTGAFEQVQISIST